MDSSASNSVSNSPISSTPHSHPPPPPPQQHQEVPNPTVTEDVKEEVVKDPIGELEREQDEYLQRHAVEARRYLMSKYFSDKTIFGGNIFDVKMGINGEQVKVSRFPGYQSYADPANFNDDSSSDSVSTAQSTNGQQSSQSANGQEPTQKGN